MMLSNILHTFSIEALKDDSGNYIQSDVEMTDGIVSWVPYTHFVNLAHSAAQVPQTVPLLHKAEIYGGGSTHPLKLRTAWLKK